MKMIPTGESLRILKVQTTVHHSLGKDYFANVYIPEEYKVLNKEPYLGTEAIPGYVAYAMSMKRKYRDVLATEDFILQPKDHKSQMSPKPVLVHFENLKQRLHKDETYHLATTRGDTRLEGPAVAEAVYPQQLGM
jgi:hypothetical protein